MEVRPESFSPKVGARLPPCGACGSQATGYHYGVNTCEACKEFFHRSLGRYKGYRCRNRETSGVCVYQPGKRKSCQFCRFQKCLRAGMSKGAIKIGRYSTVKKNRDEKEIKRINSGSGKEFSDTFDKTSLDPNSTSSSNDTGTPPYTGQTDSSCQENQLSNYNGSISSYLDTSVKKESNCKFTLFGLDMSARYPLSPYDSQPSPSILEDTKGLTKADSSTKGVNSGICIGHTSSPSRSFMPGESSSVLTPVSVSESSPTGMDGLEFPPFSPTSLNGADFHCNLKTLAEHDFKFQNRILTPKSDSSLGWWGSSESGLSPSVGERKQVHIMQMDHELSVTECQEDGSKKEETGEVSDCTSRIPSPSNEKDCMLYSGMVTGSHEKESKSEGESKSEYQDAVEVKDNCETQRKRLIKNFMEPSKGPLSEEVSDPSKFRSLSPLSSREGSPDSLPDVPNHSKPKVARGSLLPSQLPQLFADIDDVIKNLLAVHDENVADFTQVPKEEMIGHQLKHLVIMNDDVYAL